MYFVDGEWCGILFGDFCGKNDGFVCGVWYFWRWNKYGIFVYLYKVKCVDEVVFLKLNLLEGFFSFELLEK